jgi:glucosamine--fructose-6-phosphate aminotransferase (isomerizing)
MVTNKVLFKSVVLGRCRNQVSQEQEAVIVGGLSRLPNLINKTLEQEDRIIELAKTFKNKFNADDAHALHWLNI